MDGISARLNGNRQVVVALEIHPELRRRSEKPGEAQRRVNGHAAFPVDELINPGKRDTDAFGELDLGQTVRFEELALKDRSGMWGRYAYGHMEMSGASQLPSTKYQVPSTKYQVPRVPIYNIYRYTL